MLPDGNVLVEWHTGLEVDTGGHPVDGDSERRMACRLRRRWSGVDATGTRLPVRADVEASRIIDELVDYERVPGNRISLWRSDKQDQIGPETM